MKLAYIHAYMQEFKRLFTFAKLESIFKYNKMILILFLFLLFFNIIYDVVYSFLFYNDTNISYEKINK